MRCFPLSGNPFAGVQQYRTLVNQSQANPQKNPPEADQTRPVRQGKIPQPCFAGSLQDKIDHFLNNRKLKKLQPALNQINALEGQVKNLTAEQLKGKAAEFRARLERRLGKPLSEVNPMTEGAAVQSALNTILPEAFAVAREACFRVSGMRPFDVQVLGALALHYGLGIEMKTGEGKTLTAVLPAYLNALMGKGVHIATANDYLAKRDAEWMGRIYNALGLAVGCIYPDQPLEEKQRAYQSDITYGTSSEFGFDYLRDHLGTVLSLEDKMQRGFFYAIVDEADNLLIDEARVPLIISDVPRDVQQTVALYKQLARVAHALQKGRDYELDEKRQSIKLTESGVENAERLLEKPLAEPDSGHLFSLLQSLKAKEYFQENVDYLVKGDEIVIVDEFTGRLSPGRKWSDGLHLAIEAQKDMEGRKIQITGDSETLASVTYQNFFRLYPKLAGMTGTALTDAEEFEKVYKLPILAIPTNRPFIQTRLPDIFAANREQKFQLVLAEIERIRNPGQQPSDGTPSDLSGKVNHPIQPILVGTRSIEDSEYLSALLSAKGIPHNVLNAKHHEQEAQIIAEAGRLGAVTIATNMAGRGTDIKLGGSPEALALQSLAERGLSSENTEPDKYATLYKEALNQAKQKASQDREIIKKLGGLYIIGTERHEARRIDNQLAGRCARQGDPGMVRFFLSMEDELFRIFYSKPWEKMKKTMAAVMPVESPALSKAITGIQEQVEGVHSGSRIELLKYDNVLDHFRRKVYTDRDFLLESNRLEDFHDYVRTLLREMVEQGGKQLLPHLEKLSKLPEDDYDTFAKVIGDSESIPPELLYSIDRITGLSRQYRAAGGKLDEKGIAAIGKQLSEKVTENFLVNFGPSLKIPKYRAVLLHNLDNCWKEYLNEAIALRNAPPRGDTDPVVAYTIKAESMFRNMQHWIALATLLQLVSIQRLHDEKLSQINKDSSPAPSNR